MSKIHSIYCLLSLFFVVISCSESHKENDDILKRASELSDSSVFKSLAHLALIESPNTLDIEQKMQYNFLISKANVRLLRDENYKSLLEPVIHYSRDRKDTLLWSESLYLLAKSHHLKNNDEACLQLLKEGREFVPFYKKYDYLYRLISLESRALLKLGCSKKAESVAMSAFEETGLSVTSRDSLRRTLLLASIQKANDKISKSESNYLKALHIAQNMKDEEEQFYILEELVRIADFQKNFKKAYEYLDKFGILKMNRADIPKRNLLKAILFEKNKSMDSAYYHATLAAEGNDPFVAYKALEMISEWYCKNQKFYNAYNRKATAHRIINRLETNIVGVRDREIFEKKKLENENNILKISRQKRTIWLIAVLAVLILLTFTTYLYFYHKQRKHKELLLKKESEELKKDNILLVQQKEISSLKEKQATLREALFRRLTIAEKIPSVQNSASKGISRDEKIINHKIRLTERDKKEFLETVNEAYPGFIQELHRISSNLTESDIFFCCLIKINVSVQDLSNIYCVSKGAITKKKYRIKINRLKIEDSTISLDDFLTTLKV